MLPRPVPHLFSPGNPDAKDSIGARIRLLRQRRGMTQSELGAAMGVSRSLVASWETNRSREAHNLPKLAETLGVPQEFFVNGMVRSGATMTLSSDECALLAMYRNCSETQRLALLRKAGALEKQAQRVGAPEPPALVKG